MESVKMSSGSSETVKETVCYHLRLMLTKTSIVTLGAGTCKILQFVLVDQVQK